MITNKEESLVLNELEELYLSHGETSLNYTLTTRYEDLKQYVKQIEDEVYALDDSSEDIEILKKEHDKLIKLLNNVKRTVLKHTPEYFDNKDV